MGAMSAKLQRYAVDRSRPYDVIATVLSSPAAPRRGAEELEHAKARGAASMRDIGYGRPSDGYDMVAPSGEGAERA